MNINYAIDALVFVLKTNIILDSPQVVTQVLLAGRTSPRKNTTLHQEPPRKCNTNREIVTSGTTQGTYKLDSRAYKPIL